MNRTDDLRLFVDAGHTRIKVAVHDAGVWASVATFSSDGIASFLEWAAARCELAPGTSIITGSVLPGLNRDRIPDRLQDAFRFVTTEQIPDGKLDYQTPETLGIDRYLSCLGAWSESDQEEVVVLDAGTACTMDWMDSTGCYRGGVILPGRDLAAHALEALFPGRVTADDPLPETFPGTSTAESLRWGTTGAWIGALDYFLQRYEQQAGAFRLCLTGGDGEWLASRLPTRWREKATVLPWVLFEGLRRLTGQDERL